MICIYQYHRRWKGGRRELTTTILRGEACSTSPSNSLVWQHALFHSFSLKMISSDDKLSPSVHSREKTDWQSKSSRTLEGEESVYLVFLSLSSQIQIAFTIHQIFVASVSDSDTSLEIDGKFFHNKFSSPRFHAVCLRWLRFFPFPFPQRAKRDRDREKIG